MNHGFEAAKWTDISTVESEYYLHTHKDKYEILLFLDGACEFHVEGNRYTLSPGDLVIASANELHRIVHTGAHRYERYIIYIDTDFFVKNNCMQYAGVFEKKRPGSGNYFSGEFTKEAGLLGIIQKLCQYTAEGEEPVAKGMLLELLYLLKKGSAENADTGYTAEHIRKAVDYINEHLSDDLRLATIADRLHISCEYLSRLFKKQMKISLKSYITYKRLLYARQLYKSGKKLLDASLDAGFPNYSNFYRMYIKEFGHSPSMESKKAP